VGVTQEDKKLQYLRNCARYDQGHYYGLIGSHIRALVPKSATLDEDDLERRIHQGLPKVFTYPLLSQERVKLWTSSLTGTFIGFIQTKGH